MDSVFHSQRSTCPRCRAVFRAARHQCPHDGSSLQPLPQDPLVGAILGDRYRVDAVYADGALARTYLATEVASADAVLVRVMYGDYVSIQGERARFAREAVIGRRLCHPNVVRVVDSGETDMGLPYVVTCYERGAPLSDVIRRDAPLSAPRIRDLLVGMARGLEHIHGAGIVVRGLTSDAVFVSQRVDTECAVLGTAALAALPANGWRGRSRLLARRACYMSPEQAAGQPVDWRGDLYALGVLLYEMLCGRLPFRGTSVVMAMRHCYEQPEPISERVPGRNVDPFLEAVAMRLLRKQPGERYQTADALLVALERTTVVGS